MWDGVSITFGVLTTLFAFGIFMGDSLELLRGGTKPAKRKDGNMMKMIYGPMCGVRNGGTMDGVMASSFILPMIICLWIPLAGAQLVVCIECASMSCFLNAVCVYMATTGLLPDPGAIGFPILSCIFGFNLLWRSSKVMGNTDKILDDRWLWVLVPWYIVCLLIGAAVEVRMVRRVKLLTATIRLEKAKEAFLLSKGKDGAWEKGASEPTGFVDSEGLGPAVEKEQAEIKYGPEAFGIMGMALLALLVSLAAVGAAGDSIDPPAGIGGVMEGLWVLQFLYHVAIVFICKAGGFGRSELDGRQIQPAA